MKRNMDLVREILMAMEAEEDPNKIINVSIPGYSEDQVQYHLQILFEGGFIEALNGTSGKGPINYMPTGLTWKGHEFIDDIRNETVWKKTKETVTDKLGSVSLAVVQEVAKATVKSLLGLP